MNGFKPPQIIHIIYMIGIIAVFSSLLPGKTLAAGTGPIIDVSAIQIKVVDKVTTLEGTVSDDSTPTDKIKLDFYYSSNELIGSTAPLADGTWTFSKELPNGVHTLYITATDDSTPTPNVTTSNSFFVDSQRPYISAINVDLILIKKEQTFINNVDIVKMEDITRVSTETTFKMKVTDNVDIGTQTLANPITILDKHGPITGTTSFDPATQEIIFTPDPQQLKPSTNYYLFFNPSIIDSAEFSSSGPFTDNTGNTVFPVFKKFTTVSNTVKNAIINSETADWDQNPHGYYTNNVNTCGNCHNTHVSSKPSLDHPKSEYAPKETSLEQSYCMACHDGTTAAPMPDKFESGIVSKHDPLHQTNAGSCTECHNPHLKWSAENPNLLLDYYLYQHNPGDKKDGIEVGEIDSRTQLCEACHDDQTQTLKDSVSTTAYKVLHNRKASNSTGQITTATQVIDNVSTEIKHVEDYDLCFSCHNAKKSTEDGYVDIFKYYQDTNSKHSFQSMDNNSLNGNLPCAECHETHGSTNIKLLKTKLGHENQKSAYSAISGEWDFGKENDFCLKCHNGSTAIYGVTGKALSQNNHTNTEGKACSECHSDSYNPNDPTSFPKAFMEAAHGPKTGVIK
jgi:nitrate/TMAO reductase-like tetraheme cytochrome c subunit